MMNEEIARVILKARDDAVRAVQELRVEARDHILNMPGPVGLRHNSTCP